MRLGELLIEAGAITTQQLERALREQQQYGGRLGGNLIELGFLTEATLTKVLAAQLHLPRISEAALDKLPRSVLDLIPADLAALYAVCPVRLDGPRLHLAMSDPLDKRALEAVEAHTAYEIRPLVAPDGVIRHALQKYYGIIPKSKLIQLHNESTLPVLPHEAPTSAPVFDPYAPVANDLQLVEVGSRTSSDPPVDASRRGAPVSVERPPSAPARDPDALVKRLAAVETIDDVGDVVVELVLRDFARSALLLVRGERLIGWRVDGEGTSQAAVASFAVPLSAAPALTQALTSGEPRITRDPALVLPVIALLGDPVGLPTLLLPLRHNGKLAACVIAIRGRDGVEQRQPEYGRFGVKIGLAFQLIVLRKQLLE